ncbi:MAG: B12-binding domain-containing radical SAM protein [Desulfovibrio sp.]|nr:B12-binding domain-containing radical SAM protein [Desulfovibrio sp.]MBI4959106.1 B12-binding domain-containing radical SAM protein [Desulfovibrio sp.]
MRILIVAPRFVAKAGDYYEFPLGLSYVSACLKRKGFDVECLNLNHTDTSPEQTVSRAVRSLDIDLVMSGGLSAHYWAVRQVFDSARLGRKDVLTVAGGGLVSSEPELMLNALGLTAGVIGEGELTSTELVECLSHGGNLADVPGIVHRDESGTLSLTKVRPSISDLDIAPFPDYDSFGVESYLDIQRPGDNYYLYPFDKPRLLPVISSRSCPYSCTFCYHPLGKKYRRRSLESFFIELDSYRERYGINMLAILDELFPTSSPWLEDFCNRMRERDLLWIAQLRVSGITRDALKSMKEAGLFYISYGIESASPTILKSMRKHITVAEVESALSQTQAENIGIQGNLLFGDPAETLKTAKESLDWWERNPHYHLAMNLVIPYPGSVIYQQCLSRGIIHDKLAFIEQGCPPPNMTTMGDAELESVVGRIADLKVAKRMFCEASAKDIGFDKVKGRHVHELSTTCPRCGAANIYGNFVCEQFEVFKLSCRSCNQRFDCSPLVFPHLLEKVAPLQSALDVAKRTGRPLAGAPALFRPTFEEYLGLMGFAFEDFDWRLFLDDRPQRVGLEYAPGVYVRALNAVDLYDLPKGLAVFVPPYPGCENIVRKLRENYCLAERDILHSAGGVGI